MHQNNPELSFSKTCTIRAVHLRDIARCKELAIQLGYEAEIAGFEKRLSVIEKIPSHHVVVCEVLEKVVGWMHLEIRYGLETSSKVQITGIVVDEKNRGKDYGKQLLKYAEEWAIRQGFNEVYLYTNVNRAEGHQFYEKCGYQSNKQSKIFYKKII